MTSESMASMVDEEKEDFGMRGKKQKKEYARLSLLSMMMMMILVDFFSTCDRRRKSN